MSELYWGFEHPYAHKNVPSLWSRENGYHAHHSVWSQERGKNFFNPKKGNFGEPSCGLGDISQLTLKVKDNCFKERSMSQRFCMPTYGLQHRQGPAGWAASLRQARPGTGVDRRLEMFDGYRTKKGWDLAYTFSEKAIKHKLQSKCSQLGYQRPEKKGRAKGALGQSQSMGNLQQRPATAM